MDPPGSWSRGPNAMMGGGIHIQQQADGSVLINLVPGTSSPATSPQQNLSSPAAAPRTAPNAGGSDRRRDGASTSGSDGAFKCVVKGCKRKRAKEGFKTEHALVTHGVYRLLRHPSYFGWFWWSVATQLVLGNPVCLVGYTLASWDFFRTRIPYEEQTLVSIFPDEYPGYRRRTFIGIPFIWGASSHSGVGSSGDGSRR